MIVAPETEIYLLKAPLQVDESQQIDFANATVQVNYFQSLPKLALLNATYQRENGSIAVNFNLESIRSYNYVMYKNKQYSNKWFYAFITGFEYVGNTVTEVQIKTDVYQTYMFEYELKQSYIKRETVSDDTFGKNLIPEDVDTGDYIINHSKTQFIEVASTRYTPSDTTKVPLIVVQCSEKVGNLYIDRTAGSQMVDDTYIIGSMPQGAYYYFFDNYPSDIYGGGYGAFTAFRNHLDSIGKGNAIINMFLVPRSAVYGRVSRTLKMFDDDGQEGSTVIDLYEPSANTYGANTVENFTYAIPTKIGNFTPNNNKMFTEQFNYFVISNFAGSVVNFAWENFHNFATGAVQTPSFRLNALVSATTSFSMQPMNSIKSEVDNLGNKVSMEFIAGTQLPTLSWESDYYLNWIAQNGEKMNLKLRNSMANVIGATIGTGVESLLSTEVPASMPLLPVAGGTALLQAGATFAQGMVNHQDLVDQIKEEKRQADLVPNSVQGNLGVGDMSFALNSVGFGVFNFQIRENMARKIDKYLDMFGYRVNEIKVPNTKSRRYWNYIQTVGVNLEGNIPQEAISELKSMYNNGITIWHDPSHFLDYSLTNSIV